MDFLITDFGAIADSKSLNTVAIQAAIDAAALVGGRVVIPEGTFSSGSLVLKANIELHLAAGSRLLASPNYEDYSLEHQIDVLTAGRVNETVLPKRAFISGFQAHNLKITGSGEINGNADHFIAVRGEHIHEMRGPVGGRSQYLERPFTIFIIESENVRFEEFTLRDPAFWAIRFTGCKNSTFENINILTDLKVPNADGIDIDRCTNVLIADSTIITADDSVSIKSCSETSIYGDTRSIVIRNCVLTSTSGAVTLGTESVGDIRDVLVEDCKVLNSNRGFAVRSREGGTISDVKFRNCEVQTHAFDPAWWGHGEPLHVTAFAWNSPENVGDGNKERCLEGKVKDITFENIKCESEAGILNWAAHDQLVKNVVYKNIQLTMKRSTSWKDRIDLRPNDLFAIIEKKHSALEVVNCTDVQFKNSAIIFDADSRDTYDEPLNISNSPGFRDSNVRIENC